MALFTAGFMMVLEFAAQGAQDGAHRFGKSRHVALPAHAFPQQGEGSFGVGACGRGHARPACRARKLSDRAVMATLAGIGLPVR